MKRAFVCASALAAALSAGACTQFETGSATPLGPSVVSPAAPGTDGGNAGGGNNSSLVGTWSSIASLTATGSSCTNLQWDVTSHSSNSVGGTFSFDCVGNIHASGTASGQISGSDVPYQVTGTATLPGVATCPFTLFGTARLENDSIRVPYSGTTCLGPIRGEETLHRPSQAAPEPPAPPAPPPPPDPPAPPPPPPANPYHVGPGGTTVARVADVVNATAAEFAYLTAARPTDAESLAASNELLLRMIWHLQLAGFQSARQKNPSGAISNDKLAVFADGAWHAFDVFFDLGTANRPTQVIFWEVTPANPVPDGGIPD